MLGKEVFFCDRLDWISRFDLACHSVTAGHLPQFEESVERQSCSMKYRAFPDSQHFSFCGDLSSFSVCFPADHITVAEF
jgi:hypothetical protein